MSSSSSSSAPSREKCLATAHALMNAYNAWSPASIMALRTDDCEQEILPTSLGSPPMNNQAYAAWLQPILHIFRNFTMTAHDEIIDVDARKVVLHLTSRADTDIGPYANEYMVQFDLDDAGEKVRRVKEFTDSALGGRFFARLREHEVGLKEKEARRASA